MSAGPATPRRSSGVLIHAAPKPWRQRRIVYPLQAAAVYLILGLFALLPVDTASALGGAIGRTIGPRLGATRKAARNLARALPELDDAARARVIAGMWDNLGRTMAEYPHLRRIWEQRDRRIELVGMEHIEPLKSDGRSAMLLSGHLANWEMPPTIARGLGLPLDLVYRAANNPAVDRLLAHFRGQATETMIPKGPEGARLILQTLRKPDRHLGLLVDQKANDGIPVPFFGRDAMTTLAPARFGLKLRVPIVPARTERLGGARFRVTVYPPLPLPQTGDTDADSLALMTTINRLFEGWVRERPEQWLWLHRRWPD